MQSYHMRLTQAWYVIVLSTYEKANKHHITLYLQYSYVVTKGPKYIMRHV